MFSLALLAWWEIVLLVVFVVGLFIAVVSEADGAAGVLFVLFLVACKWCLKLDMWSWIALNYLTLFSYLAVYFLAGVSWSIFKWYRLVKQEYKEYQALKNQFNSDKKRLLAAGARNHPYDEWQRELQHKKWPPAPSDYKDKLIRWIATWPIGVLWALVEDFFVWLAGKLYIYVGKVYQSISDRIFEDFRKEVGK